MILHGNITFFLELDLQKHVPSAIERSATEINTAATSKIATKNEVCIVWGKGKFLSENHKQDII